MSNCASYISRTHGVIDDVTRSQSRSIFKNDISLFELERRSRAQNIGNTNVYFMLYLISNITSGKISLLRALNGRHFEIFEILNVASIWPHIWKDRPKFCQKKVLFMMKMSSMMSQGGLKVSPLYFFINKIIVFMITKKRTKISSLNFLCIGIVILWLHSYKPKFMTSLMTSPGHRVGQFLKAENIGNSHGYLAGKFNFRYFWSGKQV